jgi:histidyl-tRNA synthetase
MNAPDTLTKKSNTSAEKLAAVKGMNDILPAESFQWEWLEDKIRSVMSRHAYRNIRTPIVEPTALFVRGTGETTDIVEKEMYSFVDRMNADQLTLRPENTPGVVRAAIQHNLTYDGAKRLFYLGPMFRHERPQRGRYRQFYQLGAEALGFAGPEIDAELMVMVHELFTEFGLGHVEAHINSLGIPVERQAHRIALIAHFESHQETLDAEAQRRLHTNPLRILDSKNPAMQPMIQAAPELLSFLGEGSLKHFETVKRLLTVCGVTWRVNPRLVRGLDYYSHTVFEFVTNELGAQGTLCGGGRYDGLFEVLGGKPTPAVGWGMGLERVLELIKERDGVIPAPSLDAYAVIQSADFYETAMLTVLKLRQAGVRVQMHATGDEGMSSMKAQFKKADSSGANFALVFGADEVASQSVTVKALRNPLGAPPSQIIRSLGTLPTWASTLQSAT